MKKEYKLIKTNDQKEITTSSDFYQLFNSIKHSMINYHIVDNHGLTYFQDGTGTGFVACEILHKDINNNYSHTKLYDQNCSKLKDLLRQARHLRIFVGKKAVKLYINNKRAMKGRKNTLNEQQSN